MENIPQILIVEDDAVLVIDLENVLTRMGYQVVGMAATGKDAVNLALSQRPNAILMDINLRGEINGIQAAEQIHARQDTPIIYLTAYTDETLLQRAKLTDAYAYLAKPVREAELRASLEMALYKHSLEKRLQHLNQVLRAVRNINQLITREPDPQRLMDEACEILLLTRSYSFAWIGKFDGDHLLPQAWAGEYKELLEHISATSAPEQQNRLPGMEAFNNRRAVVCNNILQDEHYAPWREQFETLPLRSTITVPILHGDDIFGILLVYANKPDTFDVEETELLTELAGDIAFGLKAISETVERQKVEDNLRRSEAKFRAIVENSSDGILFGDAKAVISYRSPSYNLINGYNDEERIGHNGFESVHPDDVSALRKYWAQMVANPGIPFKTEYRIRHKDGRWIWVDTTSINMLNNPDIGEIVVTTRDITSRKQAEEALRASEALFRAVVENSHDGIVMMDTERRIKYVSPSYERLTGYTPDDVLGTIGSTYIHPDDQALTANATQTILHVPGSSVSVEYRLRHKNGNWIWIETTATNLLDDPHIQAIVLNSRDITSRKQAEESLVKRNQYIETIMENAPIGFAVRDMQNGKAYFTNSRFDEIYRVPRGSLTSLDVFFETVFRDPVFREQIRARVAADTASRDPSRLHWENVPVKLESGAVCYISATQIPILDQNLVVSTVQDVTEQVLAENLLHESELRFRALSEDSLVGMYIIQDGVLTYANAAMEEIFGYEPNSLIGVKPLEITYPDDREMVEENIRLMMSGEVKTSRYEFRALRKNGEVRDVEVLGVRIDLQGKPTVIGNMLDITDRKQAEEARRQIQHQLEAVVQTANDAIITMDSRQRIVFWNAAAEQAFGYTEAEILGKPVSQIVPHHFREQNHQAVENAITTGQRRLVGKMIEVAGLHKDKTEFPIEMSLAEWRIDAGLFFTAIVRDISEKKLAQARIEQSEKKYRELFQINRDGIAIFTISPEQGTQTFIELNAAAHQMLGYTGDEMIKLSPAQLEMGATAEQIRSRQLELANEGSASFETTLVHKDGHPVYADFSAIVIQYEGQPAVMNIIHDITSRKQAEEQIRKSLAEKETLLRELYHRTKNNMGVIIAMLGLQSAYFHDNILVEAFEEAQNRIRSMALVHQKLYDTHDLSHINLKEYIEELVILIWESNGISESQVAFVPDMQDVFVLIDTAIPCGLVLNELITNSLKHAFQPVSGGKISVALRRLASGEISLLVADNGVGLKEGFNVREDGRMGLKTIFGLVEGQLRAKVEFTSNNGVSCNLQFFDNLYQERI